MGSRSLQHIRNPRSTLREPSQPATFRLQGLITLLTVSALESVPVLFHTGSALGIAPSEVPSPARFPRLFSPEEPTYR